MLKCFHCGGLTAKGQVVEGKYHVEYVSCLFCGRDQSFRPRPPTPQEKKEYKGDTHCEPNELHIRNANIIAAHVNGTSIADLADTYELSNSGIRNILSA